MRKTLLERWPNTSLVWSPKRKSPSSTPRLRSCCHTKKSVEPGRYSQRSTALPRMDRKVKSSSCAGCVGSSKAKERARASVLYPQKSFVLMYGCAYTCRLSVGEKVQSTRVPMENSVLSTLAKK